MVLVAWGVAGRQGDLCQSSQRHLYLVVISMGIANRYRVARLKFTLKKFLD